MAKFSCGDEAVVIAIEDLVTHELSCPTYLDVAVLTLKASRISSSESVSFIFLAIMVKNSVLQLGI
jgi:hypothetical protein